MKITLTGCNSFYDGWIAAYVGLPKDDSKPGFNVGWETLDPVRYHPMLHHTFCAEVAQGHIKIEVESTPNTAERKAI